MAGITCGQLKTSDHTQTVQANLHTYRLNNTQVCQKILISVHLRYTINVVIYLSLSFQRKLKSLS